MNMDEFALDLAAATGRDVYTVVYPGGETWTLTADTSDQQLEQIATQMLDEIRHNSASGVVVAPGLTEYLRDLRDEMIEQD